MNLSPEVSVAIAIVVGFVAYALGRNPLLWWLVAYLNPLIASILLFLRHRNRPKVSPSWILEAAHKFKLKMWSRGLKPEDFDDGPPSGGVQQ